MQRRDKSTQLFIGNLPHKIRESELLGQLRRYGMIRNFRLKRGYAFAEYSKSRYASDAIYYMDGQRFHGHRLIVEKANWQWRERSSWTKHINWERSRERERNRPRRRCRLQGEEDSYCFYCGMKGHWARDCREAQKAKSPILLIKKRSKSNPSKRSFSFFSRRTNRSRTFSPHSRFNLSDSTKDSMTAKPHLTIY